MTEEQNAETAVVPVEPVSTPLSHLLRQGEDAEMARERVIKSITELHPELAADAQLIASLRGEAGWIVTAVPARYGKAAPLIAQAYRLRDAVAAGERPDSGQ